MEQQLNEESVNTYEVQNSVKEEGGNYSSPQSNENPSEYKGSSIQSLTISDKPVVAAGPFHPQSTKSTPFVPRSQLMFSARRPLTMRRPSPDKELHDKVREHLQLCKLSESVAWREAQIKVQTEKSGLTFRPKINAKSQRIHRGAEHLLQWNNIVKEKQGNIQKENEMKIDYAANHSKMSAGSRKMISRLGSARKYEVKTESDPVKAKLNAYLKQRATEFSRQGRGKEIAIIENVVLPNCLFFQRPVTVEPAKDTSRRHKVIKKVDQERKGLLEENVVRRSERWIQQREEKVREMKQQELEKSLKGCTFFPTFFTKTKQLF